MIDNYLRKAPMQLTMSYPLVKITRKAHRLISSSCRQHVAISSSSMARFDILPSSSMSSALVNFMSNCRPSPVPSKHFAVMMGRSFSSESSKETADSATDDSSNHVSTGNDVSVDHTASQYEFKAETRQLLDIVTHSLYADKEVFLRELISNASDALEKLRHIQTTNAYATLDPSLPLEIRIETDEMKGTLQLSDSGIGMTSDEMVSNLGTIARSGSKAWMKEMERKAALKGDEMVDAASRGIIGKFGVGFYSAFMVGQSVEVRSKSALASNDEQDPIPKLWTSDGTGTYQIADLEDNVRQGRGSTVVIHLKDENIEFSDEARIEDVITRYSNFVNFPIYLNGKLVNTISAIWTKDPKEVDEDTYNEFYQYIANATDHPLDVLHFRAEAPIDVKALLFIPSFHSEKYGMGRMEPGVALYSRKVLIENKSPDILPDWLRFLKGVVDSEDLPLAISREKAQDSNLISKLRKALTRKFVSHITNMAKKDREKYLEEFYHEYNFFLKEGICQDYEFQESLSKILYYETSKTANFSFTSLEEYIARCRPEQKDIYYLNAPSRELAVQSPYMEAFDSAGIEVIFVFSAIDEFCMSNLKTFQGRNLVNVEKGDIDLSDFFPEKKTTGADASSVPTHDGSKDKNELSESEAEMFCKWFEQTLGGEKVSRCKTTKRLTTSPAVVTDNESGAVRRIMRMVDTDNQENPALQKQQVEVNPAHPIIVGLNKLRDTEPALAKVLAEQIFDNCVVAAGLMDDSRAMLPRLNDIMLCVVRGALPDENNFKSVVGSVPPSSPKSGETPTKKSPLL